MKKASKIGILLMLFVASFSFGQTIDEWTKMKPEKRKELINRLSPEERVNLLNQFRQNILLQELEIPESKQKEFNDIYSEYQESQRKIKRGFRPTEDFEKLNDEEAKMELQQSFDVGQELLNNRKKYSERFQKVMKPQQVLKMFENEGKMRNKVMDRDLQLRDHRNGPPRNALPPNGPPPPQNNRSTRPPVRR